MVTKFSTATTASNYYNRIRNMALAIVLLGVVLGVACVIAAVCHILLWGDELGGSLLIVFGVLGCAALMLYAPVGMRKRYLVNSVANGVEESITTFDEFGIKSEQIGQGINIVKQISYEHIAKVAEKNDSYQIFTCDGCRITCDKDSLIDGDTALLTDFLIQELGAKYIDCRKPISVTKDSLANKTVIEESLAKDAADISANEDNNNENQ